MVEAKISSKDSFGYYLKLLAPYKALFVLVVVLITANVLVEVGQNFIYKIVIDSANDFAVQKILAPAFVNLILFLGLIYFVSVIAQGLSKYYRMHFLNRLEIKMMFDIKKDIFNHLLSLSHSFHASNSTGSIITRLIRSSNSVESITDFFTYHSFPLFIKLIVSFFVIAFFDLNSAVVVLIMVLAFAVYTAVLLKKQQAANVEKNAVEDFEKAFISDVFTNIETVKHFGKEGRLSSIFEGLSRTTLDKHLRFWDFFNKTDAGHVIILGFGTIGVMYFSLVRLLSGELSVGSIVFIYTSFIGLTLPLFEFFWGVRRLYEGLADLQSVVQYKKIKQEVVDANNAIDFKVKKGSIEFRNVNFGYNPKRKIIDCFNLKINPKEKVAFVGQSGAGKTTIVKLIYRFYDVNGGEILIDGKNINTFTQNSLRNELSIVPQECVLFNDTIYSNVLFSNPTATREKVFAALKAAQLYNFVEHLPEKENTIVGERGIKLSGGEKQRLSIARAILADKKILVLDEATSSLDSKTEYEIRLALEELMKGRTTIIIAHRLSTIMNADKIVVMKKGKIEQVGSHSELAKKQGIYSSLWQLQKTGAIKK
ncbi:MAG: ABC transporter ATP-binding protein [archaeon]